MIGGMFEKEKIGNVTNAERVNTIYAMSGRCALYACLLDMDIKGEKIPYSDFDVVYDAIKEIKL